MTPEQNAMLKKHIADCLKYADLLDHSDLPVIFRQNVAILNDIFQEMIPYSLLSHMVRTDLDSIAPINTAFMLHVKEPMSMSTLRDLEKEIEDTIQGSHWLYRRFISQRSQMLPFGFLIPNPAALTGEVDFIFDDSRFKPSMIGSTTAFEISR